LAGATPFVSQLPVKGHVVDLIYYAAFDWLTLTRLEQPFRVNFPFPILFLLVFSSNHSFLFIFFHFWFFFPSFSNSFMASLNFSIE